MSWLAYAEYLLCASTLQDYHSHPPKQTHEMEMFVIVVTDERLRLGQAEYGLELEPRRPISTW